MMSNLGSSAPDFKKIEKCSLNISKKSWNNFRMYMSPWYLPDQYLKENTTVCDPHKKMKIKHCYTVK
jgi:hypothetical protein